MSTFVNNKDPDEMQHTSLIRVYIVCNLKEDLKTKEYNIF